MKYQRPLLNFPPLWKLLISGNILMTLSATEIAKQYNSWLSQFQPKISIDLIAEIWIFSRYEMLPILWQMCYDWQWFQFTELWRDCKEWTADVWSYLAAWPAAASCPAGPAADWRASLAEIWSRCDPPSESRLGRGCAECRTVTANLTCYNCRVALFLQNPDAKSVAWIYLSVWYDDCSQSRYKPDWIPGRARPSASQRTPLLLRNLQWAKTRLSPRTKTYDDLTWRHRSC